MSPIYTGGPAIRLCWRPTLRAGGNRQHRVGGAHLGGALSRVNAFLQFYFTKSKKVPTPPGRAQSMWWEIVEFQWLLLKSLACTLR